MSTRDVLDNVGRFRSVVPSVWVAVICVVSPSSDVRTRGAEELPNQLGRVFSSRRFDTNRRIDFPAPDVPRILVELRKTMS